MSSIEAPAHATDAVPAAAVLDEPAAPDAHNPDEPGVNSYLLDVYRGETDSGQRICDRVSMPAEFIDAFAAARLDAAPCVVRGRYHLPHPHPADLAPAPPAPFPDSAHTRRQHDCDVLQARRFPTA
ncbi:hypothetical protein GCM10009856_20110 [Mycolicibacterium llatzerense]